MKTPVKTIKKKHQGIALIMAMVFIIIFSAISIGFLSLSSANTQIATNHRIGNTALNAALSGLDCAKYVAAKAYNAYLAVPTKTGSNTVSSTDIDTMWSNLYSKIDTQLQSANYLGGTIVRNPGATGSITVSGIRYQNTNNTFTMCYSHVSGDPNLWIESTGSVGDVDRTIRMSYLITKDTTVMNYAIAGRSRVWLAGNTTIHGPMYSAWNLSNAQLSQLTQLKEQIQQKMAAGTLSTSFATLVSSLSLSTTNRTTILNELTSGVLSPEKAAARCIGFMTTASISPFNTTSDSTVLGTINTCWSKDQVMAKTWQLETLDTDGNPAYQTDGSGNILYEVDSDGNFLLDNNGEMIASRVIGISDEIQGITAGINYGEAPSEMAGMNVADYCTTEYSKYYTDTLTTNGGGGDIPTTATTAKEYYPHAVNVDGTPNYGVVSPKGGLAVTRSVYQNQTYTNVRLPASRNALFKNCTFNGKLFVDCTGNVATGAGTAKYNNVRFDNCTFNGTIVTNVPTTLPTNWWIYNNLYFTGSANFQNNANTDATILAPQFSVNLGNNSPVAGTNNILNGAIVGGIVDVRGNAEVRGTIISMADTSSYTSGYVSNIGATLLDGGSETVAIGDVGTIKITPAPDNCCPAALKRLLS
jgi:Tfp pilus assembly protein PilX